MEREAGYQTPVDSDVCPIKRPLHLRWQPAIASRIVTNVRDLVAIPACRETCLSRDLRVGQEGSVFEGGKQFIPDDRQGHLIQAQSSVGRIRRQGNVVDAD